MKSVLTIRRCFLAFGAAALVALGCGRRVELGKLPSEAAAQEIYAALSGGEGGGDAGAEASTGTGWGTIKGRFTYVGDPPAMPPYSVNKDQAVCAPGGKAPPQEFLKVDPGNKGIANVVVYARKAPRVHESAQAKTNSAVFDQKECFFLSHVMGCYVGQTLQVKNSDSVGHNTNVAGQNSFNQIIAAGDSVPLPIKKEEAAPVAVRCSIHPWMLAYLLPRKDAYFAVTKPDGSFEIANLPAGENVELQVWHEHAAGSNGGLVVDSPEAKALKWSKKGRMTVKLNPDEVREVEIAVPPNAFKGS